MKTIIKKFHFPCCNSIEILSIPRKKILTALILLLVFLIIPKTVPAQWERTNGPEGVAISSLANINGTIYAGTEVEGMYISTNKGLSWTARNSGIETFEVTCIMNKPGYIFAGTFGNGVYRTTNEGLTWLPSNNGSNFAVTSLTMKDDFIYAGTISNGVQRSSDNGLTWEEKLNEFGVGALCSSGIKIIGSSSNYSFSSTDDGETWTNIPSLEGVAVFTLYSSGNIIYAGARNKIYKSTDNGNSFSPSSDIIPGFSIVNIYSILPTYTEIFVATSYDGVYKSTDDGISWVAANTGMGPKDVRAITISGSSTLIAGTHYVGMFRSTDLGASWEKSQQGFLAGISILSLLQYDSNIFAGTRDGVYRSDDNGNVWTKLKGNNDTVNYGDAWAMCEFDGVLYASFEIYFDASVYKSSDKGENWVRCKGNGFPPGLSFIKGLVSSGNNLVAGTDEGVFYSTDNGEMWNQTNISGLNVPGIAASGNYVYAPAPTGFGVYRSVNNGVNWSVALQSTVDYVEVAAIDNYAFAGSFFGGARYSDNFGSTWSPSNGFPADASVFALCAAGNGFVIAGTDLSPQWIYASFDNGAFFTPFSEGLAHRASVEAFAVSDTFLFTGTDYHGVWRRLRPGISGIQSNQLTPGTFELSQNYPNPFNPVTAIEYSIPENGVVELKVYNQLGTKVAEIDKGYKHAGSYKIEFNAGNLSSGVYYYKLTVKDYSEVKKMVLLK